ncbi:MAG: response regulator [Bradymonadaceae bacterium]|nr:response regulator [Lujinxingiaceae bacterium]
MAFILVADDMPELREVYKRHLEDAGHRVITAINGAAAIDAALELGPELILMDIEMPELDGISALRQIKTNERFQSIRQIPIVLLTCHALPDQITEGIEAGCEAYIIKPLDPREIVEELGLLLSSGTLL